MFVMGAFPLLVVILMVFGNETWAYPGKMETWPTSSIIAPSLVTILSSSMTTTGNQTSTSPYISSRVSTKSSTRHSSSSTLRSTSLPHSPSNAQSALTHQSTGQEAPYRMRNESVSSNVSEAQSASRTPASGNGPSQSTSASTSSSILKLSQNPSLAATTTQTAATFRPSSLTNSAASASKAATKETAAPADCNDGSWDLTMDNWNKFNTDANLKTWWHGGTDNETGVTFPKKKAPGTFFTEALAASFEAVGSQFVCTLESHSCQPADGCENYAVHIPQGTTQTGVGRYLNEVGPSAHYGWFAIHSIANLYSFSETFTSGLMSGGIQLASENIQLTSTFTQPQDQMIPTRSVLLGFSLLVAILFAFVPIIGEVLAPTISGATIVSGAATGGAAIVSVVTSTAASFVGLSLINGASLDSRAATFGAYMAMVFNSTAGAVDQLVLQLMNGAALDAPTNATDPEPSILNILAGGSWVNSSVITNPNLTVTAMTELMRDDLLQRGINYVWLQSKIYVTFANLSDDAAGSKCREDRNGWQQSKTCADGGVYYLYRFNEDGHLRGHMTYPWGADKMTERPFQLQPSWVTKGSAASYRAQNGGVGGFNYDQTTVPANLSDVFTEVTKSGTLDGLRTLPGTWNLSVCDMGTHNDWNVDFTSEPHITENKDNLKFFFPCCCGPRCSQTHDFIKSAQMENFKTIFKTCKKQMRKCSAWPADVVSIDFGDAGTITNDKCHNDS